MSKNLRIRKGAIFVVVVVLTFLSLLVSAGVRATPGVLMMPLQMELGWSRATVSSVAAFGIFLYGFVGPFSAALMQSIGIRRTLIGALLLIGASSGLSLFMTAPWHSFLPRGPLPGLAPGAVALLPGATVLPHRFVARRVTAPGLLAASPAPGSLLFLPLPPPLRAHSRTGRRAPTQDGNCVPRSAVASNPGESLLPRPV